MARHVLEGADHVVFLDELRAADRIRRSTGRDGRERFVLIGVTMSVPSTFANRRRLTTVDGLSSAKSRTSSSTSTRERSTLVEGRPARTASSENQAGSVELAPYTRVEDLTITCLTGLPACPAAASRFIVPMTLISCKRSPGSLGRVGDQEGVDDRVGLSGTYDARNDRVGLVRVDEVGTFQGDGRIVRRHPEDHLEFRIGLEGQSHPAAPEGVEAGYEYPASHGLSRTRCCGGRAACRRSSLACASLCSRPRP